MNDIESSVTNTETTYKRHLLNLLAVLHRDGGHYTEKYGIDQSVSEGMRIASDIVVK